MDQPVVVPADLRVTAWFSRGHLQMQACNYLESEYTVRGQMLDLSSMVSSAMACESASRMQLDDVLKTALQTHTSFSVDGDVLTITYPEGLLHLTRLSSLEMPTAPSRPDEGLVLPEEPPPVPTATVPAPGEPPTSTFSVPDGALPRPLAIDRWATEYTAEKWTTFGCCLLDIYFLATPDLRLVVVVEADLAQPAAAGAHRRLVDDLARSLQTQHGACLREVTIEGRDEIRIGEVFSMEPC